MTMVCCVDSEGDMPDTCGYGLLCGQSVRET